ncbi:hypothetical protein FO519_007827 [Halicephalobus sp. NKZ332]|nr:hypothetical protein FO519_007827 [Halicephalobus sp. NKZ332]
MRVAILTVSTSKSTNAEADVSGPTLVNLFKDSKVLENVEIVRTGIVADDIRRITGYLESWAKLCDVIITTGGTGMSFDDVTPEATKKLIQKDCPGIVQALLNRSLQATPMAALTRLAAGIYRSTLIINFPGSPKACRECFEVLEPILNHAVHLIGNKVGDVEKTHTEIQGLQGDESPES